jgi:hypothetical protein
MPKKLLATIILTAILVLVINVQVVEVANANPFNLKPVYEIITIQSPQNGSIYSNPISLNFSVKRSDYTTACVYHYRIDGNASQRVSQITIITQKEIANDINPSPPKGFGPYYFPYTEYILKGNIVLPYLAEGWHNITVGSATVRFYVNASSTPPNPTPNITPVPSLLPSVSPSNSPTINPNRAFHEKLVAIQQSYTLAVISVAAVIGLGVLLYFNRRKG